MLTYLTYFFAYFVHINAYECKGEILMGSLHIFACFCIFCAYYAYLNLLIIAYLSIWNLDPVDKFSCFGI